MKNLFSIILVVCTLASCSKEDPAPSPILSVNSEVLSFTAATESQEIAVNTNQSSWDAVSNQTWCTITKSENQFTVLAAANTDITERTATITVSGGSAEEINIEVSQAGIAEYPTPRVTPFYSHNYNGEIFTSISTHCIIEWSEVPGATEYRVYKEYDGEEYLIATSTSVIQIFSESEIFEPGTYVRYYWVTAIVDGIEKVRSYNKGIKITYTIAIEGDTTRISIGKTILW